jgi:hypothetical protein
MKLRITGSLVAVALFMAVLFGASLAATKAGNAKTTPIPAATPESTGAAPDQYPEIPQALNALQHAKDHLEKAKHDFGGHRADGIHACDEAIRQLEICMKYDK